MSLLPAAWPDCGGWGADMLLDLGRRPDMVIGDMDSAGTPPDDLPCMALDGQDDTDLQKCLARSKRCFWSGWHALMAGLIMRLLRFMR